MRHSNIHTHTNFSDGKNTAEEMVQKALELGFVSLGFSDHSETPFDSGYCAMEADYPRYREEISFLKEKYEGQLEIFCGIEQDFFSRPCSDEFEYTIGSVHYIYVKDEYFPMDASSEGQQKFISKHGRGDPMELAKRYFDTVVENSRKREFQVQGHFDLIQKYGLFDGAGEEYRALALAAVDEVMNNTPFIEVNCGAIGRGYRKTPYPDDFILKHLLKKGAKLVLNGDSHSVDTLNTHYEESVKELSEMGFSSLWQLRRTGFVEVPIK